jgi:hypothetical protein
LLAIYDAQKRHSTNQRPQTAKRRRGNHTEDAVLYPLEPGKTVTHRCSSAHHVPSGRRRSDLGNRKAADDRRPSSATLPREFNGTTIREQPGLLQALEPNGDIWRVHESQRPKTGRLLDPRSLPFTPRMSPVVESASSRAKRPIASSRVQRAMHQTG